MTHSSPLPTRRRVLHRRALAMLSIVAAVAAALVVFAPVTTPSAEAVFSGSNGKTGCSAVNMGHTRYPKFWYSGLTSRVASHTDYARTYIVNTSDISSSKDSSLDANTNVVMADGAYTSTCGFDWYNEVDGGTLALTTCDTVYSSGDCRQHTVRISTTYFDGATTTQARGLLCHELGHAFGLMHASSSGTCMKYGVTNPAQDWDSSEMSQINANY